MKLEKMWRRDSSIWRPSWTISSSGTVSMATIIFATHVDGLKRLGVCIVGQIMSLHSFLQIRKSNNFLHYVVSSGVQRWKSNFLTSESWCPIVVNLMWFQVFDKRLLHSRDLMIDTLILLYTIRHLVLQRASTTLSLAPFDITYYTAARTFKEQ